MLDAIAADEKTLGRSLVPVRIIRVQLLREGEVYEFKHLDGTNPGRMSDSPVGGPGWVVEAVGTFIGVEPRTGQIDVLGTHGFRLWGDAGGEDTGLIPCWTLHNPPAEQMEGVCHPPGAPGRIQ